MPGNDTRTAILKAAITEFSEQGYEGVSMRNIADAVNVSAPALYNHFKDKQSLYIAAITDSFENKSLRLLQILNGPGEPMVRLEQFVSQLCELLHDDPEFRRLIQRELLDGDDERLRYLAEEVFGLSFQKLMDLLKELKPDCDTHNLAVLIIGMIHKPFEITPLARFFSGSDPDHLDPAYISKQVMAVLSAYLGGSK